MNTPALLIALGRTSMQAGVLVLVVLLAQWLFRKHLTPRWRCALWFLIIARLFLPVSFGSVASIFNLMPRRAIIARTTDSTAIVPALPPREPSPSLVAPMPAKSPLISKESLPAEMPLGETAIAVATQPVSELATEPLASRTDQKAVASRRTIPWHVILLWGWLGGAAGLAGYIVLSSLRFTWRCRRLPVITDAAVMAVVDECMHRLGVRCRPVLMECAEIASPAVFGLFRPRLLLPKGFAGRFSTQELRFVFLHELAHVKRLDLPLNWLVAVLQVVHWFNPLVWLGFARWRTDRELACDAMALEAAGTDQNREYGRTILRLLENFTHRAPVPGLVGILESRRQLHRRIAMIANFRPGKRWGFLSVLLFAVVAAVGLTDAQDEASPVDSANDKPASPPAQASRSPFSTLSQPVVTNGSVMNESGNLSNLRAGKEVFVLKTGLQVHGLALDPEGKPLPGVLIKAGYGMENRKKPVELHTDAVGRFELHDLSQRQMILTAYPSNFAITSTIFDVTTNTPEVRLQVAPLSPLKIHVMDGEGRAIAGARMSVGEYRFEGQLLDFAGTTDQNGALTWTNAPVSPFALTAMASPRLRQKIRVTAEQREVLFKLREGMEKEIVVNGLVHDARTGSPVKLESVSYQIGTAGREPEGFDWNGEILDSAFRLKVPATRFRSMRDFSNFQLRLQATGYATLVTPWRDFDEGDWSADFLMQPADKSRKTVVLADGKPAAGAQVWVRVDENYGSGLLCNDPNQYFGEHLLKTEADVDGKFVLPSVPGNLAVVFTHPHGLISMPLDEVKQTRQVQLQPWGSVMGQVIVSGKPRAGLRVNLATLFWTPKIDCHLIYSTVTGTDGGFTFTNVPAGEYKLYRHLTEPRSLSGVPFLIAMESHQMPIIVKPGEVLKVQYGGGGRAVIGKAMSDKPVNARDWQRDDHVLVLKQPPLPTLGNDDFATYPAYWKAHDSPARVEQERQARTYLVEFEPDGSFRADDVPPGTYELRIRTTKQRSYNPRPEDELACLVREIVVPPGQEPFDLGTLTVTMKDEALNAQTLDGKPLPLEQFKGRNVLLVFWASWSDRCTEQLAELTKLHAELAADSRITIVALSMDEKAANARQAVASRGYKWAQGWLDAEARGKATSAFNMKTLPAIFLLDAKGRIVARDLEGERLSPTVKRALAKK